MPRVWRMGKDCKIKQVGRDPGAVPGGLGVDVDTRISLIQTLIPLGLHAVEEVLQQEVRAPSESSRHRSPLFIDVRNQRHYWVSQSSEFSPSFAMVRYRSPVKRWLQRWWIRES